MSNRKIWPCLHEGLETPDLKRVLLNPYRRTRMWAGSNRRQGWRHDWFIGIPSTENGLWKRRRTSFTKENNKCGVFVENLIVICLRVLLFLQEKKKDAGRRKSEKYNVDNTKIYYELLSTRVIFSSRLFFTMFTRSPHKVTCTQCVHVMSYQL